MSTPTPERDSAWISGGVIDAEDARLATGVFAAPGAGPVQARSGIKPAAGDPGSVQQTATPSGKVTVNPFQAVIQGTRATSAGAYLATLDQPKTIDVLGTAPAGSADPRHDLIVARQRDIQYGDDRTGMSVELVTGRAATPPLDPTVSGDHIHLARIVVAKGATAITNADIQNLTPYHYTTAVGGIVPLWGEANRPPDPYRGMYVHRFDGNFLEFYNGSAWRAVNDDTGWSNLPLLPNWTVYNGETPAVRRVGSTVHLRGAVQSPVALTAPGTPLISVPPGFRPAMRHHWYTVIGGTTRGLELLLDPNGGVALYPQDSPLPAKQLIYLSTTWLVG
ncbi:hypothetical protein [Streptomyces sp. NPDC000878]